MAVVPILIPDTGTDHRVHRKNNETVMFIFTKNIDNFYADHPATFCPPLPAGGFLNGNVIGPYTPNMNDTVTFYYDGCSGARPKVGQHTITIGD